MKSLFKLNQKNICALFALLMAGAITMKAINPSTNVDKLMATSSEKSISTSPLLEEDKDQDIFSKMVRMSLVPALSLATIEQILKKK